MIVAIDGPAGSGKSTTAREVARQLGYLYLDTGAMYRAVALAFEKSGREPREKPAQELMPGLRIDLAESDEGLKVYLDEEDVSTEIRRSDISAGASKVAALRAVREKLVEEQRRLAREAQEQGRGVVLDGRDIGTVVFPDADVKIFLVADPVVRAQRRQLEIQARGETASVEEVLEEIHQRDRQDRDRALAPLRKAEDAIELDTSDCDIAEQVRFVMKKITERQKISTV